jgi:hypothetical protein
MESRVVALERRVGISGAVRTPTSASPESATSSASSDQEQDQSNDKKDLATRLQRLEAAVQNKVPQSLLDDLKEIHLLEKKLHPGSYLTYQAPPLELMDKSVQIKTAAHSSSNQPLLYRQQEVLASKKLLQTSFQDLSHIQELLQMHDNNNAHYSKKDFSQAPILTSPAYAKIQEEGYQTRLSDAMFRAAQQERTAQDLAHRVDSLVEHYHAIVTALSKKMVLLEEAQSVVPTSTTA